VEHHFCPIWGVFSGKVGTDTVPSDTLVLMTLLGANLPRISILSKILLGRQVEGGEWCAWLA